MYSTAITDFATALEVDSISTPSSFWSMECQQARRSPRSIVEANHWIELAGAF